MGVPVRTRGFSENDQNLLLFNANRTKEAEPKSKEIIVEEDKTTENSNSGDKGSKKRKQHRKPQQVKYVPKQKNILDIAGDNDFLVGGRQRVYSHQV